MSAGQLTARSLTEHYLSRIEALDRNGPRLNSVIELNPDALAIAGELDQERSAGRIRGPLHGIPVLLKDNIDTADRMRTTAGSLALLDSSPRRDAYLVRRLRAAGAVILGKTNLSEWANFRSTHSTSGWSSRGGLTRNPYALDRNPCGSSSGSGVAVAAGLCAAAIGTETDGSIMCPSSVNGIVGIKPTLGLCSRSGIIPIAHSQDTAGPMARTVADAAALLGVLASPDAEGLAMQNSIGRMHADYTQFLDPDGLRGVRLGIARNHFGFNAQVDALVEEAIADMSERGAIIVDPASLSGMKELGDAEYQVLLFEFKADLDGYLAGRDGGAVRSLEALIAFNERHRDRVMPWFGQDILIEAQAKGALDSPEYLAALDTCRRLSREEGIDGLLATHDLDAIVAPTAGPAFVTDLVNGDHHSGGSSSAAAVAGYPAISVPCGQVYGLPVGISFFAGAWSEPTLIRIAHAFERATQTRQAPRFQPTAELG